MNRFDLEKFSKEEVINLLLKIASNKQSPTPAPRTKNKYQFLLLGDLLRSW